ncbi:MAG: peptidoglycan DD-metalloendopeptidase family protein [Syntrophales bacterium]
MSWRLIIIPLLLVNLLYACTGHYTRPVKTKGIYYRVKSGDTLWSIANAYNMDIQELAEANNITDPKLIGANTILFIPDADQIIDDVMSAVGDMESSKKIAKKEGKTSEPKTRKEERPGEKTSATPEILSMRDSSRGKDAAAKEESKGFKAKSAEEVTTSADREETGRKVEQKGKERDGGGESTKIKFDKERFIWPVKGKVRSRFGFQRDGTYNNWIIIAAKEGAPVVAAANGTVIFSNSLKDYGETIIIKHQDNFATVYTNLSGRMAQVDDKIKKGSRIAFLGKTEKKGEASLRFEIRHKNKARNPLFFLP